MEDLIATIEKKINAPLPGKDAQYRMAHGIRKYDLPTPDTATLAGILLLLFPKNDKLHTVFIERVSHKNDKHSGQMSFPGGRFDQEDGSSEYTALRETAEEVGVSSSKVRILGNLSELYIPVSNFLVHPFVGFTSEYPAFIPEPAEVKNIVEAPLKLLQNPATKSVTNLTLQHNFKLKDVPYFDVYGNVVWGATAMILNEFLEAIEN